MSCPPVESTARNETLRSAVSKMQAGRVRLGHHQGHPLGMDVDPVHRRERLQALVARALGRLEDLRQPLLELLRGLVADVGARGGGHAGDEVLHVAQVQAPVVRGVQVPGGGHEARDDLVLQSGDVAPRRAQVGHDLSRSWAAMRYGSWPVAQIRETTIRIRRIRRIRPRVCWKP